MCRFGSRCSLVDELFIGQNQPQYFRSHTQFGRLRVVGVDRGPVLLLNHPRDGFQPGNLRKNAIGHTGVRVVLCLLVWGELFAVIHGLDRFGGQSDAA
jgi:hypothetical protein